MRLFFKITIYYKIGIYEFWVHCDKLDDIFIHLKNIKNSRVEIKKARS